MDKLGLMLDKRNFAPNKYRLDKEQYPRNATKLVARKEKALVLFGELELDLEAFDDNKEEDKDEWHVNDDFLEGSDVDNLVNYTDEDDILEKGKERPFTRMHLTLSNVDVEALICRMNVITTRTLFIKEVVVEGSNLCPSCSIVEICRAKCCSMWIIKFFL